MPSKKEYGSYVRWTSTSSKGSPKGLIISAHGEIRGHSSKHQMKDAPANLHFFSYANFATYGDITDILAMKLATKRDYNPDFDMQRTFGSVYTFEPKGTSGLPDQNLSYYESDTKESIAKVTRAGYHVVTIKPEKEVRLSKILGEIGGKYKDICCHFCRVHEAVNIDEGELRKRGAKPGEKIRVHPKEVTDELKKTTTRKSTGSHKSSAVSRKSSTTTRKSTGSHKSSAASRKSSTCTISSRK